MHRCHRGFFVVVLAVVLVACGQQEPQQATTAQPEPTTEAPAAPVSAAEVPAAETEAEAEPAEPAAPAEAEAEPAAEPAETPAAAPEPPALPERRILMVGADGHHRDDVTQALADVAGRLRQAETSSAGGRETVSWTAGDHRVVVVDFADLPTLQAAIGGGSWSGAVFVSDPAQSTGNRDAVLDAAREAGITRIVLFQVVSDLLTDMEVYDLEAQVWPDELSAKGFAGEGMPTLQADVAKAAAGDATARAVFEELVTVIERHLAQ